MAGRERDPVQGQFLRLSARREVAIYLLDGTLWVADFIDGHGELFQPETWFRFHCGSLDAAQTRRRMLLEAGMPLSPDIVARIKELHRWTDEVGARQCDGGEA